MDSSFAITGKGYVIVAADMTAARSIVKMQSNVDKIKVLGSHLLMAYSGEPGKPFNATFQFPVRAHFGSPCTGHLYPNDQLGYRRYRPIRRIHRA